MWSLRSPRARVALSAAAVSGVLLLAGCSDNSGGGHDMSQMSNNAASTTSSSSTTTGAVAFNDADVMFLQMMYPHHAQAVEMANMALGRTTNPQVLDLAKNIAAAQGPEMEQMTALLAQRGLTVPSTDASGGMSGMNHGGPSGAAEGGMSGMMTPEQMTDLAGKSGADFDTAWLNMMIEHHTGAIEMAQTELADGENAEAKQMATDIIAAQQAEITTMQALLQQN
ncbi:DUF305 domain-containing protein [Rhodococcus sp. MSC1_016]|jgi:uncharacterized protein (DUF305 family)|uniref:DUF305 domain-containing protein n=1 Tax=Rhodococcus sp. MSC1_016 TaxID=2909266 RepID=UPI002030996A|nr:DUF305 domain-containing protein [Rhodococcus sp. MSC1_016]